MQDVVLVKRKMTSIGHVLLFYISSAAIVTGYYYLSEIMNPYWLFFLFWPVVGLICWAIFAKYFKSDPAVLSTG
jgi:hypothetical protein